MLYVQCGLKNTYTAKFKSAVWHMKLVLFFWKKTFHGIMFTRIFWHFIVTVMLFFNQWSGQQSWQSLYHQSGRRLTPIMYFICIHIHTAQSVANCNWKTIFLQLYMSDDRHRQTISFKLSQWHATKIGHSSISVTKLSATDCLGPYLPHSIWYNSSYHTATDKSTYVVLIEQHKYC